MLRWRSSSSSGGSSDGAGGLQSGVGDRGCTAGWHFLIRRVSRQVTSSGLVHFGTLTKPMQAVLPYAAPARCANSCPTEPVPAWPAGLTRLAPYTPMPPRLLQGPGPHDMPRYDSPAHLSNALPAAHPSTTAMVFCVSVPVLSEQMAVQPPMVSHASSTLVSGRRNHKGELFITYLSWP